MRQLILAVLFTVFRTDCWPHVLFWKGFRTRWWACW